MSFEMTITETFAGDPWETLVYHDGLVFDSHFGELKIWAASFIISVLL